MCALPTKRISTTVPQSMYMTHPSIRNNKPQGVIYLSTKRWQDLPSLRQTNLGPTTPLRSLTASGFNSGADFVIWSSTLGCHRKGGFPTTDYYRKLVVTRSHYLTPASLMNLLAGLMAIYGKSRILILGYIS